MLFENPIKITTQIVKSPHVSVPQFRRLLMICGLVENPEVFFNEDGTALLTKEDIFEKLKHCSISKAKIMRLYRFFKKVSHLKKHTKKGGGITTKGSKKVHLSHTLHSVKKKRGSGWGAKLFNLLTDDPNSSSHGAGTAGQGLHVAMIHTARHKEASDATKMRDPTENGKEQADAAKRGADYTNYQKMSQADRSEWDLNTASNCTRPREEFIQNEYSDFEKAAENYIQDPTLLSYSNYELKQNECQARLDTLFLFVGSCWPIEKTLGEDLRTAFERIKNDVDAKKKQKEAEIATLAAKEQAAQRAKEAKAAQVETRQTIDAAMTAQEKAKEAALMQVVADAEVTSTNTAKATADAEAAEKVTRMAIATQAAEEAKAAAEEANAAAEKAAEEAVAKKRDEAKAAEAQVAAEKAARKVAEKADAEKANAVKTATAAQEAQKATVIAEQAAATATTEAEQAAVESGVARVQADATAKDAVAKAANEAKAETAQVAAEARAAVEEEAATNRATEQAAAKQAAAKQAAAEQAAAEQAAAEQAKTEAVETEAATKRTAEQAATISRQSLSQRFHTMKAGVVQLLQDHPEYKRYGALLLVSLVLVGFVVSKSRTNRRRTQKNVRVLDLIVNDVLNAKYQIIDPIVEQHGRRNFRCTTTDSSPRYIWHSLFSDVNQMQFDTSDKQMNALRTAFIAAHLKERHTLKRPLCVLHLLREDGSLRSTCAEVECALQYEPYMTCPNDFLNTNIQRFGIHYRR
jgi:hypothetical protein